MITAGFFVLMALAPAVTPGNIPVLTDGLVLLLMAYAWNIVGGFLGELSFAHMIFWGIGGYGAVEVVNHSQPFLLWLVLLVAIAVVAGVLVAGLIRLSGLDGLLAVSIFTMVLGQIAITFAIGSTSLGGVEGKIAIALPPIGTNLFFLCLVVLAGAAAFTNVAVANSRFGRELLAIRDDVVAAEVAGIHVSRRRNQAYMLSAGFFAVGGAYQSYYSGFAIPDVTLGVATLILVSLAVFIGGAGTSMGPLLGTLIIYGLEVAALQVSTDADVSLYAQLTEFAVALLLLRLVIPRLKGLDLATAATRLIPGQRNRSLVAEEDIDPALSSKDAATDLVARGLSELDAPEQVGLEICGLRKSFGRLEVLRDVSFAIRPGEVVGIVGPNGAGKSTLCNLISGVTPASGGQIVLNGTDVTRVPSRRRASVGVGRSFQTPRLFSSLSLAQNLSISGSQVTEREAEIALNQMGIPDGGRRRGDDSQFFARRLTEVTKAALNGRSVLLLDEPLAGLTPDEHAVVLAVARKAADAGACVAIVEHLIPVLAPAVDRIVVLADGHMIADGPPAAVLQEEAVVDAYLGTPHQEEAE